MLPACLLLPFINKAFHIDDTLVLIYARAIARAPTNPFTQVFEWDVYQTAIVGFPHPLLWPSLVALVAAPFGEREWVLHLLTFAFAVLGLHGLAILARRLGVSPVIACLLLAGSSAFLVMGSTIMSDMALMGCTLGALARLVRGIDGNSVSDRVLAGVLAGMAFQMRYTGLIVVGLLLAYPLLRRRLSASSAVPFLIGSGFIICSEVLSLWLSGKPHLLLSMHRWSSPVTIVHLVTFGFALLIQLGGQFPLTGVVVGGMALRDATGIGIAVGALVIALGVAAAQPQRHWWFAALLFAWPALVIMGYALVVFVRDVRGWFGGIRDERSSLRLLCALWLPIGTFVTISYIHVATKYALLSLPAAILLLLDALRGLNGRRAAIVRWWLVGSAGAALLLGLLVAVSDYRWAGTYRHFFAEIYPDHGASTGKSYFIGDWGFRYYGERAGLIRYRGEPLTPEDRLFVTEVVSGGWRGRSMSTETVAQYRLSYGGPFAIMSLQRGAGFYSNSWGLYPYVPAREVTDTVLVVRAAGIAPDAEPR